MIAVSFGRANLQVKTEMPAGLPVKSLLFFSPILTNSELTGRFQQTRNLKSHENPFIIYEVVTYEQSDTQTIIAYCKTHKSVEYCPFYFLKDYTTKSDTVCILQHTVCIFVDIQSLKLRFLNTLICSINIINVNINKPLSGF